MRTWHVPVHGPVIASDLHLLMRMAEAGLGLAYLRDLIRLLRDATPVEVCPAGLTPPVLPDVPPARGGFTVVEWGVVLREGP